MQPMQMLKSFIGSGMKPENIIQSMMKNNNNPMINNLFNMAKKGDSQGVETFARNLFKEQGRDFDKEFAEFRKNFK